MSACTAESHAEVKADPARWYREMQPMQGGTVFYGHKIYEHRNCVGCGSTLVRTLPATAASLTHVSGIPTLKEEMPS